jgi:hypothetical protein
VENNNQINRFGRFINDYLKAVNFVPDVLGNWRSGVKSDK